MNSTYALLSGMASGFSLIVAIGAQNAFVLRQGVYRSHVGPVVAICVISDAVLIAIGVSGSAALIARVPELSNLFRFGGAAFLLVYGLLAASRALRPGSLSPAQGLSSAGLAPTVATCLAFTWLNPHVYLDTVVILGSLASEHDGKRQWFALGAIVASTVWFTGLGYGARFLRPLLERTGAWRVLDGLMALAMLTLAVLLIVAA